MVSRRRLRQTLLCRIHRHYATVAQTIDIGGEPLTFWRVADANVVLDDVARMEDQRPSTHASEELRLPYWAELWDSAIGLGIWLAAHRELVESSSVLDLGCGMGLAGT